MFTWRFSLNLATGTVIGTSRVAYESQPISQALMADVLFWLHLSVPIRPATITRHAAAWLGTLEERSFLTVPFGVVTRSISLPLSLERSVNFGEPKTDAPRESYRLRSLISSFY
jgi:hypothetical protein